MKLFEKIVNDFQPITIFVKTFFHLRCLTGYVSDDYITFLFFRKTYASFSYTSYLYQHSTDFRINMVQNKYKCTQKFDNVHIFIKWTLQYVYNMFLSCPQIKLHNEIHNTAQNCTTKYTTCCTIRLIGNFIFLCVFVLLNRWKMNFISSVEYSSYFTNFVNTNCFIKCAT